MAERCLDLFCFSAGESRPRPRHPSIGAPCYRSTAHVDVFLSACETCVPIGISAMVRSPSGLQPKWAGQRLASSYWVPFQDMEWPLRAMGAIQIRTVLSSEAEASMSGLVGFQLTLFTVPE